MIDTHCHLNSDEFSADLPQVLERMRQAGVVRSIVVGTDLVSSQWAIRLAEKYVELYASVGLHPHDVPQNLSHAELDQFASLLSHEKVVAVGEVGLDYSRIQSDEEKIGQHQAFTRMIDLANQYHKPMIIHSRMAEDDVIKTVHANPLKAGAVIHCYTADYDTAKKALDLGLYLSFTGIITYPKSEALRQVVKNLPHDWVMVETDSPFLAPQSKRGQRCEPSDVNEVGDTVASCWGRGRAYVDEVTTSSAIRLFNISVT